MPNQTNYTMDNPKKKTDVFGMEKIASFRKCCTLEIIFWIMLFGYKSWRHSIDATHWTKFDNIFAIFFYHKRLTTMPMSWLKYVIWSNSWNVKKDEFCQQAVTDARFGSHVWKKKSKLLLQLRRREKNHTNDGRLLPLFLLRRKRTWLCQFDIHTKREFSGCHMLSKRKGGQVKGTKEREKKNQHE